jgi:hypothetical protein
MDITLAEAEQNYKNQMFKNKNSDIKFEKTIQQTMLMKETLQVVENNAVNKTNI